jgi:enoyl-CoA hydratase/carnithine racemase
MTGALYDAATLERWNVVNRVLPDDGFDEAARALARGLAEGPTLAHAATKRLVRAQVEGGTRAADALVPEVAGALFGTADLQNAVRSFLEQGPGKATYEGR